MVLALARPFALLVWQLGPNEQIANLKLLLWPSLFWLTTTTSLRSKVLPGVGDRMWQISTVEKNSRNPFRVETKNCMTSIRGQIRWAMSLPGMWYAILNQSFPLTFPCKTTFWRNLPPKWNSAPPNGKVIQNDVPCWFLVGIGAIWVWQASATRLHPHALLKHRWVSSVARSAWTPARWQDVRDVRVLPGRSTKLPTKNNRDARKHDMQTWQYTWWSNWTFLVWQAILNEH